MDPKIWLAIGGLLVLVGIGKIISKGLSMALWVVLLIIGVSLANYGLREGGVVMPPEYSLKFEQIIGPGKAMTEQTLQKFCDNMLNEGRGSQDWCRQMQSKAKSEWSASDASLFAQQCIFNNM